MNLKLLLTQRGGEDVNTVTILVVDGPLSALDDVLNIPLTTGEDVDYPGSGCCSDVSGAVGGSLSAAGSSSDASHVRTMSSRIE